MELTLDYLTTGTVIDLGGGVTATLMKQRTPVTRALTTGDGETIWMPASTVVYPSYTVVVPDSNEQL